MNHVQEPPNIIPAELLKSDSLISSSINDYINKLNTLQYLQKNNPNYPIPLPSKHNSQIDPIPNPQSPIPNPQSPIPNI